MEYAFDTDPRVPDSHSGIQFGPEPQGQEFELWYRRLRDDLEYRVETSGGLTGWETVGSTPLMDEGVEWEGVTLPLIGSGFLRLSIEPR